MFTPFIEIQRSVKQGGPCSAYFFLVLAEVLALELKKNKNISGFVVSQITKILGQYADDMDMYLLGGEKSLNAVFQTIEHFKKRSGFRINYEKTTIYRIGSIKKSLAKLYTKNDVRWTNEGINVLGVEIRHDTKSLMSANNSSLLNKSNSIMKSWGNRSLSLFGKIQVINTLVASLFVYKMSVLPMLSTSYIARINTMIENFLWDSKKPKIKLSILQGSRADGGAGLVNFKIKDIALKASWVKIIQTDSFLAELAYRKLGNIGNVIWKTNLKSDDVYKVFGHGFWPDVLAAWSCYNFIKDVAEVEISNQVIWLNSHLRIANSVFFYKNAFDEGLLTLNQLITPEGCFLPIGILERMFNLSTMQCNSILSSIPRKWVTALKIHVINENCTTKYESVVKMTKTASFIYRKVIVINEIFHAAHLKWVNKFSIFTDFSDFTELFKNVYKVTNNSKLRSFQFRLLHNAIILNDRLSHMIQNQSNLCSFCQIERENVTHFFYHCKVTHQILLDVKTYCLKYSRCESFIISLEKVLSNQVNANPAHIYNFVILITKHYLYVSRCLKTEPSVYGIIRKIRQYENYESFAAKKNNRYQLHLNKWSVLKDSEVSLMDPQIDNN